MPRPATWPPRKGTESVAGPFPNGSVPLDIGPRIDIGRPQPPLCFRFVRRTDSARDICPIIGRKAPRHNFFPRPFSLTKLMTDFSQTQHMTSPFLFAKLKTTNDNGILETRQPQHFARFSFERSRSHV